MKTVKKFVLKPKNDSSPAQTYNVINCMYSWLHTYSLSMASCLGGSELRGFSSGGSLYHEHTKKPDRID